MSTYCPLCPSGALPGLACDCRCYSRTLQTPPTPDHALFYMAQVTTPQDLIVNGLYKALAVALHSAPFWSVSLALTAKALGAFEVGGQLWQFRKSQGTFAPKQASQRESNKQTSAFVAPHSLPDTHAESPDAHAESPDAHAESPDAHAESPDAHAESPDAHAESPDAHTQSPAPAKAASHTHWDYNAPENQPPPQGGQLVPIDMSC